YGAFPEGGLARMALPVTVGTGIQEICRRCVEWQIEPVIGLAGEGSHGLVLEDEVSQPVEDRAALVYLYPHHRVRAVPGDDVGSGIHRRMGEIDHTVSRFAELALTGCRDRAGESVLVRVDACNHPVRLPARLADPF